MADLDRGWTLVNTKQKKIEGAQKRKERQKKERAAIEDAKKKFEKEVLLKSYSGFVPIDKSTDAQTKKKKKRYLPQADNTVSETVFSAFSAVEERKMMSKKDLQRLDAEKQAAEGKKKKPKAKKLSVKSVVDTLKAETLNAELEHLPERFPNHYELQLKSLAEIFEGHFGPASLGSAKVIEEKPFERKLEIPLCYLTDEILAVVVKWLKGIPEEHLASFCLWLIKEAHSTEKRRSSSAIGLKMLIQILSVKFPSVSVRCIQSKPFQERFCIPVASWEELGTKVGSGVYTKQSPPPKLLPSDAKVLRPAMMKTLVWLLGQAIKDSPSVAFIYWYQFLLPLLCIPIPDDIYDQVFVFLAALYPRKTALERHELYDESTVAALERMIVLRASMDDKTYTASPFSQAYPFVEKLTLWSGRQTPHYFFPMLLRHAGSAPKARRDEILERLVKSLSKDQFCYSVWQKVYPGFVAQSSNLVLYISENWDRLTASEGGKAVLSAEKLLESVEKFLAINKEIQNGTFRLSGKQAGKKLWAKRDIEVCNVTCKKITSKFVVEKPKKASSGNTYIVYLFVLLLILGAAAVAVRYFCIDGQCQREWCALVLPSCRAALHLT